MPRFSFRKWVPIRFPSEDIDDGLNIFISDRVFSDIQEHSQTDRNNEVGGFLLGDVDPLGPDNPAVLISASIRATHTNATSTRLEFTGDTWAAFHQEREERFDGKKILGWYHTHPGHGIFLSNYDTFIHENFYADQRQVALVVDPIQLESGFFKWTSNGLDSRRYYGFDELCTSDDQSFNPGGNLVPDTSVESQTVFFPEADHSAIFELPIWLSWIDKLPGSSLIMKSVESSISRGLSLFSLMALVSLIVFIIFALLILGRLGTLTGAVETSAIGADVTQSSGIVTRIVPPLEDGKTRSVAYHPDSGFLSGLRQIEFSPVMGINDAFEISVQNILDDRGFKDDSAFEDHDVYGSLQVITPDVLPGDIKNVLFRFVVPDAWLEMYSIDPEEIRLWRLDEDWVELAPINTSPSEGNSLVLTFTSEHLTYFALSGLIGSSDIPRSILPPTAVPPTAVPPTAVPPTAVPPTAVPPTAVPPEPTQIPSSSCDQVGATQGVTGSGSTGPICN